MSLSKNEVDNKYIEDSLAAGNFIDAAIVAEGKTSVTDLQAKAYSIYSLSSSRIRVEAMRELGEPEYFEINYENDEVALSMAITSILRALLKRFRMIER